MKLTANTSSAIALVGLMAMGLPASASAQEQWSEPAQNVTTVYGTVPADLSDLAKGPEVEGIISARSGNRIEVTDETGTKTVLTVSPATQIKARGGFLGLGRTTLEDDSLMNGLPVTVKTVQWEQGLIAERVSFSDDDLEMATMIRAGTEQGFAEQTAATEALRGRVGDIDQYNVRGTTNVYFDSGKYELSNAARTQLCSAAAQADSTDNALLLVVGYTDSTGSYEVNQELSEKRAERVVNHLQQECGWAPYRMLTPTGMAAADPAADNTTAQGKQQNRRVAVNILVSKAVDGLGG